jgi:hypothetical protein
VAASSSSVRRSPRKLSAVSDTAISSGLCVSPRRVAKQVTSSNSSSSYIQNRLLATLASSQNDFMSPSEPTFTEVLCTPDIDGIRVSPQKTTTPGAGSSSSDTCENQTGSAATHTSGVVRRSPRKTSGATVTPANISSRSSPLTTPAEGTGKSYCSW